MLICNGRKAAVLEATDKRRAEAISTIGKAKELIRDLEQLISNLDAVDERVEFMCANELDVKEENAREAVIDINTLINALSVTDIKVNKIKNYCVDGSEEDVINRLVAIGNH